MTPTIPEEELDEAIADIESVLGVGQTSRSQFQTFQKEMRELDMKRRRENIHVLIALGVIGAYFSFVANVGPEFLTETQQTVTLILVVMSGLFLFIKMSTITFRPDIEHRWIETVDERIAPAMHMMSIYGLLIVGIISWISRILPEIPQRALEAVLFGALMILVFGIFGWVTRVSLMNVAEREEELQLELTNILTLLRNEGDIEEARSNEILQRFERILGSKQDIKRSHYMKSFFGDGPSSPFVLKPRDRRRIENVIERIKIKKAQSREIEEDLETISQLLTEIEER